MANGQQKAEENFHKYQAWESSQTTESLKQIIYRESLSRKEIALACGFAKSALNQNPAIKNALSDFENKLREKGVLPPTTAAGAEKVSQDKEYDAKVVKQNKDSKRLSSLEAENIELKATIAELENKLARFGELSEVMSEIGFMPR